MDRVFRRLLGTGIISILLCLPVRAEDPLDDVDGTEGWDQVVQPRRENKRDMEAERDAFKREVADWESIRQLWEEQRERYIMEKTTHQRQFKRMKAAHRQRRRPPPKADITEETLSKPKPSGEGDWGDEPGQEWFQGATPAVDSVIDDELGETGAVPGASKEPAPTRPAPVYIPPPSSSKGGDVPDAFKQRKKAPDPEAEAAEQEIRRMREAEERKRHEAEEQRRLQEEKRQHMLDEQKRLVEERKRREEEARRKKEEEAAAGAAAAEALLKRQEEEMRKEQEAIRKKAKLKVDEEGQMVDPELQKEMEEEEEEEKD
jgi:hypothetical protein